MTTNRHQELRDTLEQLIDSNGLRTVLRVISEVCSLKEEHIQTNWQDDAHAKLWRKVALMIDRCADNLPKITA